KVLIVDDSTTVRKIVQRALAGSIFRMDCYEAPDGETALADCARIDFDVIFLDCNMPGLDGLATLDRLRLRSPSAAVVMISAERALQRGAAAFMYKPFRPRHVDAVLRRLFGLRVPDLMVWGDSAATRQSSGQEAADRGPPAAPPSGGSRGAGTRPRQ